MFRAVLGSLVLIALLAQVFYAESSPMVVEYYVYEITASTESLTTNYTVKLIRIDDKTFRVELLRAEPEDLKVQLESRFNLVNWTLELAEVLNTGHYFLFLPGAFFQPYIDPELIKVGCEKAYEIEKVVKDYVNPQASNEQRLELFRLLKRPSVEVIVISMLVGDPLNNVGLQGYTGGFRDAYYKLTAMCSGSVYTFNYTFSFRYEISKPEPEYVFEATSRYSTTGWLVNAKFTHRATYETGDRTTTRILTFEQKLVETSNEDLKAHALSTPQPGLRELGELLTSPVAIFIAVAVAAAIAVSIKLVKARK